MDKDAYYAMWLEHSENWWRKEGNPLHVWRVIALCLSADPVMPIPGWCLPYLATTARNIDCMTRGHDFRGDQEGISPAQALAATPQALGFSSQGKKSAFADIQDATRLAHHALDAEMGRDAVGEIAAKRNVSPDTARRKLAKAKKLARLG